MSATNIHCKIELVKDVSTNQITFTIHLNPQASNIKNEEHTISWTPSVEEQIFLIDTIKLLQDQKDHPLVTFRKKNNTMPKKETQVETIETINQTIDNLPKLRNDNTNQTQKTEETISEIINQNKARD